LGKCHTERNVKCNLFPMKGPRSEKKKEKNGASTGVGKRDKKREGFGIASGRGIIQGTRKESHGGT